MFSVHYRDKRATSRMGEAKRADRKPSGNGWVVYSPNPHSGFWKLVQEDALQEAAAYITEQFNRTYYEWRILGITGEVLWPLLG